MCDVALVLVQRVPEQGKTWAKQAVFLHSDYTPISSSRQPFALELRVVRLSMSSKGERRARPTVSHFDVKALEDAWAPLARLRDARWSWDGGSYTANTRTKTPHGPGLLLHYDALHPLLRLAPTGFPSHPQLKSALESLNKQFGILEVDKKF